jgi:thiamine biosynthesis protein ThiI
MVILVRYGEIALKSRFVRRQFTDALVGNIHQAFAAAGQECITSRDQGRLYVRSDDQEAAVSILSRVFGIVSVSQAVETEATVEAVCREGVSLATGILTRGMSFAVRARRTGSHAFTSQDVAVALGRAVQEAVEGTVVDLTDPQMELHVEVRGPKAYLFTEKVPGPGGLPLGTQGKVLAVVNDERDAVAAWMMMKRGCRVVVVTTEGGGREAKALGLWDPNLKATTDSADALERVAAREGAEALISGGDLPAVKAGEELPTFHPTVGMTDSQVSELWERIRSEGQPDEEAE